MVMAFSGDTEINHWRESGWNVNKRIIIVQISAQTNKEYLYENDCTDVTVLEWLQVNNIKLLVDKKINKKT